ncbi:MAG: copper amine oxidase-like protein [Frankiales bacterium]|nr:copper amine oxidase-like protein [Frankiales bacterium]
MRHLTPRPARFAAGLALFGTLLTPLLVGVAPDATAAAPKAPPRAATPPGAELGYDRLTLRRGDTWLLKSDLGSSPSTSYKEETGGWMPVAGDTNGDGVGTLSLFKDGVWLIRDQTGGPAKTVRFGQRGDIPLLGDWNGDGIDSVALFRKGRWFLRDNNAGPSRTFGYGLPKDLPVVGDWNGDGRTDIAVVRNRTWYQRDAASAGASTRRFDFGNIGDKRFAGDWDHDGRDSPGVFRDGIWYLRQSNVSGRYTTAAFGRKGDTPLVRRTPGLAPGVTHRVVYDGRGPFTEHIVTIDLAAASSPDVVLGAGRLRGIETTSSIGARTGAVLAINGDYFTSSGRPVHAFATDGRLVQTPQVLGRAFGIDVTGTRVQMGFPQAGSSITTDAAPVAAADGTDDGSAPTTSTLSITRWNSGPGSGTDLAAYTAAGSELETPPAGRCYAGLAAAGSPVVHPDGGVDTAMTVTGTRCGGGAPLVPASGAVLDGDPAGTGGSFLATLHRNQSATLTQNLGFPGAVDVLGGNPVLISGWQQQTPDLSGAGSYFDRQPRTALGVTEDGKMLLVVVDGRQAGYSAGMTLQELADLMTSLGARDAINLDGGGSTAIWVNGTLASRPSDGFERGVGSALVVLPGADPGQADVTQAAPGTNPPAANRPRAQRTAQPPLVSPVLGGDPVPGWRAAAADPGSVGGLADALRRKGDALSPELQRADAVYDATR